MDEDFEIELLDDFQPEPELPQLPTNFLSFGDVEEDDVRIYIHQSVYEALEDYSARELHKEQGSILLGDSYEDQGKHYVVISRWIEAKYTDASAATLTFTHETWDYVHKERSKTAPDKKIVGWQHTHPNYGIFLSNYDLFIQENFFNLPFQIAYVVDPVQSKRGFFQWKNGKVEKLRGFHVYNDVDKPVKIQLTKGPKARKSAWKNIVMALLAVAAIGLGCLSVHFGRKYEQQQRQTEKITDQLTQQDQLVADQEDTIAGLEQMILASAKEDGALSVTALLELVRQADNAPEGLEEKLTALAQEQSGMIFEIYTVAPGDSLVAICQNYSVDYYAYKDLILGLNGLEDGSYIEVGQKLLLPTTE